MENVKIIKRMTFEMEDLFSEFIHDTYKRKVEMEV